MKLKHIVERLIRKLPGGAFGRGVVTLVTGTAGGQLIAFLILPVITRLYSPENFGFAGVFASVLGILTVFGSLRYEYAIMLPKSNRAALSVLALAILILLFISVAAAFFSYLALAFFVDRVFVISDEWIAFLLFWGLLFTGAYQIFSNWAVRCKNFGAVAATRLQQAVFGAFLQVLLGVLKFGPLGLIGAQIVGQASGGARLCMLAVRYARNINFKISFRKINWAITRYKRFPIYEIWSAAFNVASAQAPALLFAFLFSAELAGFYILVSRALSAPLGLIGSSVSQVLFSRIKEIGISSDLSALIFRVAVLLSSLIFIPFGVFISFAQNDLALVLGKAWTGAGVVAAWSAAWIAMQFVYSPISVLLICLEKHGFNLKLQIIFFVFRLVAIFSGYLLNSQLYAVVFYSMVSLLCYFGAAVYLLEMAGVFKKIAVGLLLKEIAIGVVAGLVVYSFSTAGYAFAISISLVLMSLGLLRSYFKYRSFSEIKV